MEHHNERLNMIEKQFEKLLDKYPGSAQRRTRTKGINQIAEANESEEDEDKDDEEAEEEDDVEEQFAEYSR
jgi:hypothetical protein